MAAYTVLANRYRPRIFDDVVGQQDVARVLRSAIANERAGHAFLFSGPRGVGKTSMARILAKAFNCLKSSTGTPCDDCRVCLAIDGAGECLDVVEIDGASHNRVENVRELIENLRFRPVEASHRIYIIDEVHMLSTAAFNALLKTLEEPPEHAKFILATTEPLKVPETIRSRCQLFDFRRLTSDQIAGRLSTVCASEGVTVPDELPRRLARHAQGGMRDALSLLDQLITFSNGAPTIEDLQRLTGRMSPELLHGLVGGALSGDTAEVHRLTSQALDLGSRAADLVGQLTEVLEGLLVTVAGGEVADVTDDERKALGALASGAHLDQVLAMLDVLVEAARRLRQRHDGRLVVEMAVLTMARLAHLQSISDLLAGAPMGGAAPGRPGLQGAPASGRGAPASARPAHRGAPAQQPASQARSAEPARQPTRPNPAPSRPAPQSAAQVAPPPATAPTTPQPPRAGSPPGEMPPPAPRGVPAPPPAPSGPPRMPTVSTAVPPRAQVPVVATADGETSSFRAEFVAALPSRSLRSEFDRYIDLRVEGDELVLVMPADGPSSLFAPTSREVSEKLKAAALKVTGRELSLRPEKAPAVAPPADSGSPAGASTGQQASAPTGQQQPSSPARSNSPEAPAPSQPGSPPPSAQQPPATPQRPQRPGDPNLTAAEQR
ncbi:MAG: DNA polymerase-3 subunit gamma/tau, partial [Pseudohongiellaceae bacterium]